MGIVIEFPGRKSSQWERMEKSLRRAFEEAGASNEVKKELIGRIKNSFDLHQLNLSFPFPELNWPPSVSEQERVVLQNDIIQQLQSLMGERLFEFRQKLFEAQLDLYVEYYRAIGKLPS